MGRWILRIGCHDGTWAGRDTDYRKYDTREEAVASYEASRRFWHSIGYQVWFATIEAPDSTKTTLEQNPYR